MSSKIVERFKIVPGVAPSSDVYNGNPATVEVNMGKYDRVLFVIDQKTAGTNTGKATVTLESCDNAAGANAAAMAGKYYKNESAASSDDLGAATAFTTSGFSTTANKTAQYLVEVKASDLPDGQPFVRLTLTEATDDPVIGSVIAICEAKRCEDPDTMVSAIA